MSAEAPPAPASVAPGSLGGESHLANITQLTFGGENAEAYWSPDGEELIFQSSRPPYECDQIFRIAVPELGVGGVAPPEATLVSTGEGRTTCAYFAYPDGERILYSSTDLGDAACPPPPDRSRGYVWPIYDTYDIFLAWPDGSERVRLTDHPAYDAEATVCPVDGSIVFTSTRDGDLDLYRMDFDGKNVQRLTHAPGYDGGAFFSPDCSQIVWRASRPQEGNELDEYRDLLEKGLVRPGRLDLWVADADGENARRITYLETGSFAPYFHPDGDRVLFSTNYGSESPREFEIWAVDVQGTRLERITRSPGFDGFPMFSPDGRRLAFASNRNQGAPGETNVFVADWRDFEPVFEPRAADRWLDDVSWLADDEREGRGIGTQGLEASGRYIAGRLASLGVQPAGEDGWFQPFEVEVEVAVEEGTSLILNGVSLADDAFRPLPFATSGSVTGEVIAAGYGITAEDLAIDDYAGLDVAGKVVLVRRFVPAEGIENDADQRRYSDLRYKAWNAREHGAAALLIVDLPEPADGEEMPEEASFPVLRVDSKGDAGLPVAMISRAVGAGLFSGGHRAQLELRLTRRTEEAFNVVGKIPAGEGRSGAGAVVLGAHYDHLGFGGSSSLSPDSSEPHNGADDNASGVASLLEAARQLMERPEGPGGDIYLVAFSAEESGLLGSTHFTRQPPADLGSVEDLVAMVNMDMVGRLRNNLLAVLGGESAAEWGELVPALCAEALLECTLGGDGYGPSDQTPFYAAGVPVLHLFTGTHNDYHKDTDDTPLLNAAGGAQIASLAAGLAAQLADRTEPLSYQQRPRPLPAGDSRSSGASLGTIPDYAGPPGGGPGVLLAGVRPGSAADRGGLQRGDVLVSLGGRAVADIYDFVYILRDAKPGETATAVVVREGERLEFEITYGRSGRMTP
ncbi:MAG: M20/M25/M40 family metallo-hydrolase [Acidobacteriota bacterium]